MITGRIKGRIRHSFCRDVQLQVCKLAGSIQKTIRQLCQVVVGEGPGEERDKNSSVRLY